MMCINRERTERMGSKLNLTVATLVRAVWEIKEASMFCSENFCMRFKMYLYVTGAI